jgi:hypothetical protein
MIVNGKNSCDCDGKVCGMLIIALIAKVRPMQHARVIRVVGVVETTDGACQNECRIASGAGMVSPFGVHMPVNDVSQGVQT